jgi:hypothetical protein
MSEWMFEWVWKWMSEWMFEWVCGLASGYSKYTLLSEWVRLSGKRWAIKPAEMVYLLEWVLQYCWQLQSRLEMGRGL